MFIIIGKRYQNEDLGTFGSPSLVGAGAGAWAWMACETKQKMRAATAIKPKGTLGIAAISRLRG